MAQDQNHPLENRDRPTINRLLTGDPTPENLAELARLRIRYLPFPGARQIQTDLNAVMQKWQLTEEQLLAKTREIHANGQAYLHLRKNVNSEDWS